MAVSPAHPTLPARPWRWFFALVRGLWLACWAVLVLAVLTWGAVYFYLAPHVGAYKGQLERLASHKLGLALSIDSISANTDWIPRFDLRGVRVRDAAGRLAIELPQIEATLTPASIWRLGFDSVTLVAPNLEVRRDATGRIFVGGIDLGQGEKTDADAAADWFFSLSHFNIVEGRVRWVDEKRQAPPVSLSQVRVGIRNRFGEHDFFLDAQPQSEWGERVSLQAHLRSPLLSRHAGAWRTWKGVIYTDLPLVDVAHLDAYLDGQIDVQQGVGALRSWADFDQGHITGLTLDLAVARAKVRLARDLPYFDLQDVQGRVFLLRTADRLLVATRQLQFTTEAGVRWPSGDMTLEFDHFGSAQERGQLLAERVNLQAVAQLAERLPLASSVRQQLLRLQPKGQIQKLNLNWQGPSTAPLHYRAQGQVLGLSLAAEEAPPSMANAINLEAVQAGLSAQDAKNIEKTAAVPVLGPPLPPMKASAPQEAVAVPRRPGFAGVDVDFDVNEAGGQAKLAMQQGFLEFPGVFEEPRLPFDRLSAQATWRRLGTAWSLDLRDIQFANADAQGSAKASWHTSLGEGAARFPGVLDLEGSLVRGQGNRVWRYLPLQIPREARAYVQHAVQSGVLSQGVFKVKGNLLDIPSRDPKQSTFHIAAQMNQGVYQYVPTALLGKGERPWPALSQLSGQLVFDGYGMQVRQAQARVGEGAHALVAQAVEADLPDFEHPVVQVQGKLTGDLGAALQTVRDSALDGLLAGALHEATGAGTSQIDLKLQLPIDALAKSKIAGQLQLADNRLEWGARAPVLQQMRGQVRFDENGFVLDEVRATVLGGGVQIKGGMGPLAGRPANQSVHLEAKGVLNSEGLHAQNGGPVLAALAATLQGSSAYALNMDWAGAHRSLDWSSSLQGMAIHLPDPLGKAAQVAMPLHIHAQSDAGADELRASLGQQLSAHYQQAVASSPRGLISLGLPPANAGLPATGVLLTVQADAFNLGDWQSLLGTGVGTGGGAGAGASAGNSSGSLSSSWQNYLPNRLALRLGSLEVQGRRFHAVNADIERAQGLWKAQWQSQELVGQLAYREADAVQAGQLSAHLKRLDWTQAQAEAFNNSLNTAPERIPALDVVVDDFSLHGLPLGKLEINASNDAHVTGAHHEWRLNKLNISNPESQFVGTGAWLAGPNQGRTVLNFKWDVNDAGKLLDRLGQAGVLAKTKGTLEGQVSWQGAISAPDYPSMNGKLQMHFADGRFLKADPGAAKLLGVLNLQALPRRLALDFRDVFAQGFSFDFVRGDIAIQKGLASTNNLQIKGVNAAVLMEGVADIKDETQDLRVVVVPQITAGTAALVATAINPAIGLGAFLAQWVLSKPVSKAATQEFRITGSWAEPKVEKLDKSSAAP